MAAAPNRRPEPMPLAARIALAVLLILLAHLLIAHVDQAVTEAVRSVWPAVRGFFRVVTEFGDSKWYLIPSGIAALVLLGAARGLRDRRTRAVMGWLGGCAAFVFVSVAGSGVAANGIKMLIGRGRPKLLEISPFQGLTPLTLNADYHSFPSGHTNTATALALAMGFLVPWLRVPLFALAILVGISRVVVSAHFVTDVLGGAALAVVTTFWLRALFAGRGWVFRTRPDGGYALRWPGRLLPAVLTRLAARIRGRTVAHSNGGCPGDAVPAPTGGRRTSTEGRCE